MSRPLLTAAEAAERLRTAPVVVVRAIRAGKLRASKPGVKWLISEDDLQAYIDAHANTGRVA